MRMVKYEIGRRRVSLMLFAVLALALLSIPCSAELLFRADFPRSDGYITVVGSDLGSSRGRVEVVVTDPSSTSVSRVVKPTLRNDNWSELFVKFNTYYDGFSFSEFVRPLTLRLFNSSGSLIDEISYPFKDVQVKDWFSEFVVDLWKRGALDGEGGNFRPADPITRAEFVKILTVGASKICGSTAICWDEPTYDDVDADNPSHWFYPYVKAAWNYHWLDTSQQSFRPHDPINRAEVAKLMSIVLGLVMDGSHEDFTDVPMGLWYSSYVYAVADANLMTGYLDRSFRPEQAITRAEASKVVSVGFRPELPEIEHYGYQGKIVILIHGLWSSGATWGSAQQGMIGRLEEEGFRYGGDYHNGYFLSQSGSHEYPSERADLYTISFSSNDDLTLAEQATELGAMVNRLVAVLKPEQIVLVGHSMGGLAARAYLELPAAVASFGIVEDLHVPEDEVVNRSIVRQLITVGTPHQGTPWPRIIEAARSGEIDDVDAVIDCDVADAVELTVRAFDMVKTGFDVEDRVDRSIEWFQGRAAIQLLKDINYLTPGTELWKLRIRAEDRGLALYDRVSAYFIATNQGVDLSAIPQHILEHPLFLFPIIIYPPPIELIDQCIRSVDSSLYEQFFYQQHVSVPGLNTCHEHDWLVCDSSQLAASDDFEHDVFTVFGQWHLGSHVSDFVKIRVVGEIGAPEHE